MYSNIDCIICLEKADFACSGKCRRHFCKSCFTSPEVQSLLQITSGMPQQSIDRATLTTFTCIHCLNGQDICYHCFLPTSLNDFSCKYANCNTSAHLTCLMNSHKQGTCPNHCPLHTCVICNSGKQTLSMKNRNRRMSESFMLTCVHCLKTAHLTCNNSHPIFQMLSFSNNFTEQTPVCSVLCRQCRMQIDSSLSILNNSCNFRQKYKNFRLNELKSFRKRVI